MSLSTDFGAQQQWAQLHFGGVALGDVSRTRRVVTLAAGWVREPGASILCLGQRQAYASKAAYQLLGHAQATPDTLQAPQRQLVKQQLRTPDAFLLIEDTTELGWPEAAERRACLGPAGPGKATSQGVLLHSLVAAAQLATDPDPTVRRSASPLLGLLNQQFHVRQSVPEAEKAHLPGASQPRQGRPRESALWAQLAGGRQPTAGRVLGGGG